MRTARLETVLQWQYIKCLTESPAYRPLSGISILSYAIHSLNVTLGGPQMNKFEQVSSDDHQMSPAGGWGKGSQVWCPGAWGSQVWCLGGEGWAEGLSLVDPVQWGSMHHD